MAFAEAPCAGRARLCGPAAPATATDDPDPALGTKADPDAEPDATTTDDSDPAPAPITDLRFDPDDAATATDDPAPPSVPAADVAADVAANLDADVDVNLDADPDSDPDSADSDPDSDPEVIPNAGGDAAADAAAAPETDFACVCVMGLLFCESRNMPVPARTQIHTHLKRRYSAGPISKTEAGHVQFICLNPRFPIFFIIAQFGFCCGSRNHRRGFADVVLREVDNVVQSEEFPFKTIVCRRRCHRSIVQRRVMN